MTAYIDHYKKSNQEMKRDIFEAIEVLSALGDFTDFKRVMIAKRK
jgi:hypothetical protein